MRGFVHLKSSLHKESKAGVGFWISRTCRTYEQIVVTVYSVELCGIILTATIAVFGGNSQTTRGRLIICVDNQAAIKAVECSGNSSGQHLIKIIVILIDTLRARGVEVEIH